MERADALERMRTKAAELLELEPAKVVESASLVDDLGVDSLDVVEYVMALEDEFGVELPEGDLEEASSVGDLLDVVMAKVDDGGSS